MDEEHEEIPILGRIIRLAKKITVNRRSQASVTASIENITNLLNKGGKVFIFPEGTTFASVENFKMGAFYISHKNKIPIVPIFLEYKDVESFYFCPPWDHVKSLKKIKNSKNKSVIIHTGKIIYPEHYSNEEELKNYCLANYKIFIRSLSTN